MNISSLVSGAPSYIYHWKDRAEKNAAENSIPQIKKIKISLLRGASIHSYINQKLDDFDKHVLFWKLPYDWKDGTKDITLIGHWDNTVPIGGEAVLCEWKTTEQEDIKKNGLLLRAKRQIGAYASILKLKTGVSYECFVVIINSDLHIIKLTDEEIQNAFEYVRRVAYQVAREFDIAPELPQQ